MDFKSIHTAGGNLVLTGVKHLNLDEILGCGQCFRWERLSPGNWRGVACGNTLTLSQEGAAVTFLDTSVAEFETLWRDYFDLNRSYGLVKKTLAADRIMGEAIAYCPGMRVLRQEPWEALCSFILSANNNIARIKGIVDRLCQCFGEPIGEGLFAFPAPERMAALTPEDLAPLRCGYRAAYLIDAARRVASGALELAPLFTLPVEEARSRLRTVQGVGPKVAECVLLYGFGRAECVPVDVWIGRALKRFYPHGIPAGIEAVAGLGQQYLFHFIRSRPEALEAVPSI